MPGRVEALDLIRGVAVLGILAINIGGFAGPPAAVLTPHLIAHGSLADEIAFAAGFVLFEGKMRALFTLLFGASLVLFIERADAQGRFGDLLQLRRLGWLMLFGLAHFYLFWWGDILFIYAIAGILALFLREMAIRPLVVTALTIFVIWHTAGAALSAPALIAEERVRTGTANVTQSSQHAAYLEAARKNARREIASVGGGFVDQAAARTSAKTFQPFITAVSTMGETLPLILLGIALYRSGFFTGGWPRRRLLFAGWAGTGAGLALTAAMLGWAWPRGFPLRAMEAFFLYWTALPHLLMGVGYAAFLVMLAPRIAGTVLGSRLIACGRMAFSNYLATSIVMTAIFYGWGFGLIGRFGHAEQWLFVLLGCALMLAWSKPWLARYRRGPLEWIWRSLTERRILGNRR